MILHDLEVGGSIRCICQGCWGQFFWLVQPRHSDQGNLVIGVKRPDADALVIWFVVGCGSDVDDVNGRGVSGVEGASIVADVAVAVVVKCIRLFTDDGVNTEVGVVDRGGMHGNVDGDADRFIRAVVAAVVGVVVIVIAVAAPVVVTMRSWWGVSDIRGDLAEVEGMP